MHRSHLRWLSYLLLYGSGSLFLLPFIWLLLSTSKTNIDVLSDRLLPSTLTFDNYIEVFTQIPMLNFIANGLFVAILAPVGSILASAIAAFVFAKLNFSGKHLLFGAVLATMMIPSVVTLIPLFIIIMDVGLIDSLWALILPSWTGSAFAVFFLRQHMLSVPHELYEAAVMEGCSPMRIFASIYLPLVKPALATLAVLNFMVHWNDLLGPLIYLSSPEKMTVPVGLTYFAGQYVTNFPVLLAGVVVSLIPTFILFLFAQEHLTKGMLVTGIK